MCAIFFCFEESVGRVDNSVGHVDEFDGRIRGVEYGIFVPKGINSIGVIVLLFVYLTIVEKSKGGQLIELFWRRKS